jgi:PAS domain S-box-containing protein
MESPPADRRRTAKRQTRQVAERAPAARRGRARGESVHQVREKLARLAALVETSSDAIIGVDLAGTILSWNLGAERLSGYSAAEVMGRPLTLLVPPERQHEVPLALDQAARGKPVQQIESLLCRRDGRVVNVSVTVSPFHGEQGTIAGASFVARDITERVRTEERLRLLESAVEHARDAIVITTADLAPPGPEIVYVNSAFTELTGYSRAEVLGRSPLLLQGAATDRAVLERLRQSLLAAETFHGELTNYRKDGSTFEMEWHVSPIRGAEGRSTGAAWVHAMKDVTARRQAELRAQRLTAAVEQAVESIVILGPTGIVDYVNPAFTRLSGCRAEEIVGRRLHLFPVGPADRAVFRKILRTVAGGQVWQGVYTAQNRGGSCYEEEATISPVRDGAGAILNYFAVCRDVTERRRLEAIAESVNMMENVGYIFSNLRHELGNPVNSIKTALSVLRKNLDQYPQETVQRYLDLTLVEVGRVEYLLQVLRTFNMYETPKIERVDMVRFVEGFCRLVRDDFSTQGIAVAATFGDEVGEALADPRALHQVLLNLLTNAADAVAGRDDPAISIRLERRARAVELAVVDNGAGMTDAQKGNLFRPFYTAKPHGTGLGLVIVKKLVTKMDGTIEVTSRHGEGTEVRISLRAAAKGRP